MKKILSLALAAVMTLLATALPAFGAETPRALSLRLMVDGVDYSTASLQPGREYRFPVLVQYEDEVPGQLREEDLEGRRLTAVLRQGEELMETPALEEEKGKYSLVVKTKPVYDTAAAPAELTLRLINRAGGKELARAEVKLTVGSAPVAEEAIRTMAAGQAVKVENSAPVLTGEQLGRLAELNRNEPVTLAGDGWEYTAEVGGLDSQNLAASWALSMDVLEKYPGQSFYFLSFPGEPDFGAPGTMVLDVEELTEFDDEFYLYRRLDGRLYYLRTQYDSEAKTLTFHPSQLGSYLITDKKLTDVEPGSIV